MPEEEALKMLMMKKKMQKSPKDGKRKEKQAPNRCARQYFQSSRERQQSSWTELHDDENESIRCSVPWLENQSGRKIMHLRMRLIRHRRMERNTPTDLILLVEQQNSHHNALFSQNL